MKNILILAGPTASGKSALAIALAREFSGTIINADSMQIYSDLRVLSARPSAEDETLVPHRLYGALDGAEVCSAARWREMAVRAIEETLAEGRLPIVCGGTGLYLRALTEGLSNMPDIPGDVRDAVRDRLAAIGPEALHGELAAVDPVMAGRLNPTDQQRIARAMEVFKATGRSLADWQADAPLTAPPADWQFTTLALVPPRDVLYERCNKRFGIMLEQGAIDEVKVLKARNLDRSLPVMRALGVPELIAYLDGEMTLEEAETKACTATRRYAKRQNTWIRNQIITKKAIESQFSKSLLPEIFSFIRNSGLTG